MDMTTHAEIRAQQRGIPPLIVDWLLEFGKRENDGRGAVICHLDKHARRRIAHTCGSVIVGKLGGLLDAYLVLDGEKIVTVGRRFKPIRH